jgi:hypothetical protein
MHTRSIRPAAALAALALAGSALAFTAPAAQAAPVFTSADLTSSFFGHSDGSCSTDSETGSTPLNLPVTENGPAVSGSQSVNATVSDGALDSQTGTAAISATGSVSSVGTNLKSMSLTATGVHSVTQSLPVSACAIHFATSVELDYDFVVTQPGFLNVNLKNRGPGQYSEFYIEMETPTSSPYHDIYGEGLAFDSSTRVYLPAGTYTGYLYGQSGLDDVATATSGSGSSSVTATFNAAGSQTAAVSGKGKKYVTLPSARSCTTDSLNPTIVNKKKKANQIKQVKFFVNDKLVKKVKTPDKGDAVTVPVADDQAADLVASVKLFPKKKGKPGKVYEVSASYEACSP